MLSSLGNTFREDAVFLGLFFLAFFALALLGLDLFSGSGWSCTDVQKTGPDVCFGIFSRTSAFGTSVLFPVAWTGSSFMCERTLITVMRERTLITGESLI